MDDNTKEVLILLITTCSTIGIAWIRMRGVTRVQKVNPGVTVPPDPTEPDPNTGV
jgi:hypothetical protein